VCLAEGGVLVRWRGWWGLTGARGVASLRARHAGSGTHGQSVREVWIVRPLWTQRMETSLLSSNYKLDLPSLQKLCRNLC
jgi:hypothetical protein